MSDAKTEEKGGQTGHAERHKRILQGKVVSDKMEKTIVVQVSRRYRHPRYRKYINEQVRYKAHDERNEAKVGDKVRIVESRPLSRDKRWRLASVVEKAQVL
ncbi:MAG: 30S ribosomal protein S17 [Nannocystaceae bacterium]|nr:30S ribosomal protein S17 [Nannocystaceae bacterium]